MVAVAEDAVDSVADESDCKSDEGSESVGDVGCCSVVYVLE